MLVTMIKTNFVIISYVLRFWIFIFVLKKYTLEFCSIFFFTFCPLKIHVN